MYELPKSITSHDCLIYLRKSRADDPAASVSDVLSRHEQILNDWCDRNLSGGRVPESNRYREVVSGETLTDRPEIQRLLLRCESPDVRAVIVVEPQRLSRGDLEDIGHIVKLLRYTHTLVITPQWIYDCEDERDRDSLERELKRGNEYLEYQKKILSRGRKAALEAGSYSMSNCPYGYRKKQIRRNGKSYIELEPDPETAKYIPMIFDWYVSGKTPTEIASSLSAIGAPVAGGGRWNRERIFRIIRCRAYIGTMQYGFRKIKTEIRDGEVIRSVRRVADESTVLTIKDAVPPLIQAETFDLAAFIKASRRPVSRNYILQNPLSGIIFCKNCGSGLRRQKKGAGAPEMLRCPNAGCTHQAKMADVLDAVRSAMTDYIADLPIRSQNRKSRADFLSAEIISAENSLAILRQKEIALWGEKIGGMPERVFEPLRERISADILDCERKINELRREERCEQDMADAERFEGTLHDAINAIGDAEIPAADQNRLIAACISKIEYSCPSKSAPPEIKIKFLL